MSDALPIQHVTVHPDGAVVRRGGTLTPDGGELRVRGLPLMLEESSLRAQVQGGTLQELRLELELEGLQGRVEPELLAAVAEGNRVVARLELQISLLLERREGLDRLRPPTPGDLTDTDPRPGPARLRTWMQLEDELASMAETLDAQSTALELEHERQVEALGVAVDALRSASSEALIRHWQPTRVAVLAVQGEGPLQVQLSYRVQGAIWSPAYALHADDSLKEGELRLRAVVAQATGEDWKGVSLRLSTATSSRRVDLPDLAAVRLGVAQPKARPAWRPLPPGLEELFPSADLSSPSGRATASGGASAQDDRMDALLDEAEEHMESVEDDGYGGGTPEAAASAPMMMMAGGMPEPDMELSMPPPAPAPQMAAAPKSRRKMAKRVSANRPRSAPRPASAPPMPSPARGGGGPPGARAAPIAPPPPPRTELADDVLAYGRLRMGGFGEGRGRRGRLRPMSVEAEMDELGLPRGATSRLLKCLDNARRAAKAVGRRRLPSHHQLPGSHEGADHRFDVPGRVDVGSTGDFNAVGLGAQPAKLRVRYRAVAREDARVFRIVQAELGAAVPLRAGPVDVFVGGSLLRTVAWKGASKGSAIRLDLGPEDGLTVARNVRYSEESAGLLRNNRRLHTHIEVELASALSRAVKVELLERLPVPGGDDVEVTLADASPDAEVYKGDRGGAILEGGRRQWLVVPPGGAATARLHYAVTIGAKEELQGGDRRA